MASKELELLENRNYYKLVYGQLSWGGCEVKDERRRALEVLVDR